MAQDIIGFKINHKDLDEIIDAIELKGKDMSGKTESCISDFIIQIEDKNVFVKIAEKNNALIMDVYISPIKTFGNGSIPVSIESFRKQLETYEKTDDIEIYYDKNEGICSFRKIEKPRHESAFEGINIENISTTRRNDLPITFKDEIPSFVRAIGDDNNRIYEEYVVRLDIDVSNFNKAIKDSDLASIYVFPIKIDKRELIVNVENEKGTYKSLREIEFETIKYFREIKEVNSTFGPMFTNLVLSLKGKIRMYFTDSAPLYLVKESKNYTIKAYLMNSAIIRDDSGEDDELMVEDIT